MNDTDNSMLNLRITTEDIKNALNREKRGKATGNDDIPIEVLNNDLCIMYILYRPISRVVICQEVDYRS